MTDAFSLPVHLLISGTTSGEVNQIHSGCRMPSAQRWCPSKSGGSFLLKKIGFDSFDSFDGAEAEKLWLLALLS